MAASGPEAGASIPRATFGLDPERNDHPYLYTSAVSSTRNRRRLPANAESSLPLVAIGASGIGNRWPSTSVARSSSTISSDGLFASQQFVQQEYEQAQIRTSFDGSAQQLGSPTYSQPPFELSSQPQWGGGFAFNDGTDGGGLQGFPSSPVFGASQLGSYDRGSSFGSPQAGKMSGGSGINFSSRNSLANYPSAPTQAVLAFPASSRHNHDNKRVTRRKTSVTVDASARECSKRISSSSVIDGGDTAHRSKRKLRSGSRRSKNTQQRVEEMSKQRKSRESHNLVEKRYRNRLNVQFESLLHSLPEIVRSSKNKTVGAELEGGDGVVDVGEKRVSKARVLELAQQYIKSLEDERASLENERDALQESLDKLRQLFVEGLPREGRVRQSTRCIVNQSA